MQSIQKQAREGCGHPLWAVYILFIRILTAGLKTMININILTKEVFFKGLNNLCSSEKLSEKRQKAWWLVRAHWSQSLKTNAFWISSHTTPSRSHTDVHTPLHPSRRGVPAITPPLVEHKGGSALGRARFMMALAHAPVTLFKLAFCKVSP